MNDAQPTVNPQHYHDMFGSALQTLVQGRRIRTFGIHDVASEVAKYVDSVKDSPTGLAAAFIAVRQLSEALDEALKPMNTLLASIKNQMIPQLFDDQKTKTVSVEVNGVWYRVSVSEVLRASIKASEDGSIKEKAYQWLRDNGLDELITETVNASTLAATAKSLLEEGKELDPDLFAVAVMPNTSVTKVPVKTTKTKEAE